MDKIKRIWADEKGLVKAAWLIAIVVVFASMTLLEVISAHESGPTVVTDRADYPPGSMVIITGHGWTPGERVAIGIEEDPSFHPAETLYSVADEAGDITNQYIVHDHQVGQTITLTAAPESAGAPEQTTFTVSVASTSDTTVDPQTSASPPTVTTDKNDYLPGETVFITGSGWAPSETVALVLVETPFIHPAETLYAVASPAGDIENSEYVIQEHDLGQSFTLTATGQRSGWTAETSFTDACNDNTCPCGTCGTNGLCGAPFKANTVVCKAASGASACDADDTCTGTSGTECPDKNKPAGTTCPSDGNACTLDQCNGTSNGCQHPTAPNGTTCPNGTCQGGTCQTSTCGNGTVEAGEACDDGNTASGDCCSATCQFEAPGAACGNHADTACSNPDTCNGAGVCQPNNEPATTNCGDAGTECTNQDKCDGNGACHDNGFKASATTCTGASQGGECNNDAADHCSGDSNACVDAFKPATTNCGDAGTECTNQDTCSGTSGACTDNGFKSATTHCTGASQGGECNNDATDHCSGDSNACVDAFKPATTNCGDAGTECTNQDTCSGTSGACTDNGFKSATTHCTGASQGGECNNDAADHCTGDSNACVDTFKPATTNCGDAGTECTNQDTCSGTSGACADNGFKSATTHCTGASQGGECNNDGSDHCSGGSNACVDAFKPATTSCGDAGTECRNQDTCSGTSGACTDNGFKSATTHCTGASQGAQCDADGADHCTGTGDSCMDVFAPPTTSCGPTPGQCENQDTCSGTSALCVDQGFKPATASCTGTSQGGECDNNPLDHCTGTDNSCVDVFMAAGTSCTDEGNECTDDQCDGVGPTCQHINNTKPCTDGAFCNGADTCSGGTCSVHAGDPCPGADGDINCKESCDEAADNCLANDPNGSACNDGSTCTNSETCQSGVCKGAIDVSGILQPINPGHPTSIFKYKSTIPVKIQLQCNDDSFSSTLAPQISVVRTSGSTPPSGVDEASSTSGADTGTTMRFTGAPDNLYIYNLATKPLSDPSAAYQITVAIPLTGQTATANIGLKP